MIIHTHSISTCCCLCPLYVLMRDSLRLPQLGQFEEDEAGNQECNSYSYICVVNSHDLHTRKELGVVTV